MDRENPAAQALFVVEILVATSAGWMQHFSFLFGGESYDYTYEVGFGGDTERQARDQAKRLQTLHRARRNFLQNVELGVLH